MVKVKVMKDKESKTTEESKSKARILVVEDERIVGKDLQLSLQRLGYEAPAIFSTGEEAVAGATDLRPDIVLMDIVLKGEMDGVEAAREIRDRLNIPVVFLTAYADDATLKRALVTEPFGYIIKPFEERVLFTTIEMALYKHRMEKQLRESEQWLSTTLRSIGDGVIATDSDGCVKFMNNLAEEMTGWSEEEALDKELTDVFRIVNEYTREKVENPVSKALREGVIVGLANHTMLIKRDGTERPIADSAAPIKNNNGSISGVVLVFRDVTAKKRMEEEVRKIQKLESVGILAGGVAHDFNNLLTAILGNIGLAMLQTKPGDKVRERMMAAEKATFQARDLTQQLLTFAKGGKPMKRSVSIAGIVEESASFALRGSNIRYEVSIADDLSLVEADPGQMKQVFNNLFINANHAMPEGGTIDVRVENVMLEKGNPLPLPEGRFVKISIEDRGVGISRDHLLKIFDPYFTTKQKGSGLGLSVCYSILSHHQGLITADSKLGAGTTFSIYLPPSTRDLPGEMESRERLITGKGRILVMDDEENVLDLAARVAHQRWIRGRDRTRWGRSRRSIQGSL